MYQYISNLERFGVEQEQSNTTITEDEQESCIVNDAVTAAVTGDDINSLSITSAPTGYSVSLGVDDCGSTTTGSDSSPCLQDVDLPDIDNHLATPALSPTPDSEPDTDISSIQTPPLNDGSSLDDLYPIQVATSDDNDESIDFFRSLTPSIAFRDALCEICLDFDDLEDEPTGSLVSSEAFFGSLDNFGSTSYADVPAITITDDSDESVMGDYHEPGLVSTPSTHALYELEAPWSTHSPTLCQEPPKPHAPIPISFAPTLPHDHYIFVPPPGSNEYFYNPGAFPTHEEEELPTDSLRSTGDLIDAILDDWILGSVPRRRSRTAISSDDGPSALLDEAKGSLDDLSCLGSQATSDFSILSSDSLVLGSAPRARRNIRRSCNTGIEDGTTARNASAYLTGSEESPTDLLRLGLRPTSDLSDVKSTDPVQAMAPTPRGRSKYERSSLRGVRVQIGMGREAMNKAKARNVSVSNALNIIIEEDQEDEEERYHDEDKQIALETMEKEKIEDNRFTDSLTVTITDYSREESMASDEGAIGQLDSTRSIFDDSDHPHQRTTSTELLAAPQLSPTQSRSEISATSPSKHAHSSFNLIRPLRLLRRRKDSNRCSPLVSPSNASPPLTGLADETPLHDYIETSKPCEFENSPFTLVCHARDTYGNFSGSKGSKRVRA
jgi:hypothetical protein